MYRNLYADAPPGLHGKHLSDYLQNEEVDRLKEMKIYVDVTDLSNTRLSLSLKYFLSLPLKGKTISAASIDNFTSNRKESRGDTLFLTRGETRPYLFKYKIKGKNYFLLDYKTFMKRKDEYVFSEL